MSSETVTRNDLSAILNEVLPSPADMTPQEVEDFVDGIGGGTGAFADKVIEQGTSGIWTYRKWNSGIAECWGEASVKTTTSTGSGGSFAYYGYTAVALPFAFAQAPIGVSNTLENVGWWNSGLTGFTTTSVNAYVAGNSNNATKVVQLFVYGKWK